MTFRYLFRSFRFLLIATWLLLRGSFMAHVMRFLLTSTAGLAVIAGAHAADLPARTVAPVEYVRVCSTYGSGFFYIPGTESCLRVGGRMRAELSFIEPVDRQA